ncbi:MAG: galactokinase family protein [Tissierellia bacterium]|nr:galactokinase family protein [Tissierellia bacterium]
MATAIQTIKIIKLGKYDSYFSKLYCDKKIIEHQNRYISALEKFIKNFGDKEISIYSSPGRTEIGGNHTDHQRGCVLAASINLDTICIVSKNQSSHINLISDGYNNIIVDIDDLTIHTEEKNTSSSLIRGISAKFNNLEFNIGGFDAYMTSNIPTGSGLSSSAAFEVLIGTIFNNLFNDGCINSIKIAQIGQYAENVYFGKPCGLMDQIATSIGSLLFIDFKNPNMPIVEQLNFNFENCGHTLCIVNTGGSHADLTHDYESIPKEMKSVANEFKTDYLRNVDEALFFRSIKELRKNLSDRAILRAIHFFNENKRPTKELNALKNNNFTEFLELIRESGRSSYMYNQNVYIPDNPKEQSISLAISLSEKIFLNQGACRVHGGGFAGTIQAFVPNNLLENYINVMEDVFGQGCCLVLKIRQIGSIKLEEY